MLDLASSIRIMRRIAILLLVGVPMRLYPSSHISLVLTTFYCLVTEDSHAYNLLVDFVIPDSQSDGSGEALDVPYVCTPALAVAVPH